MKLKVIVGIVDMEMMTVNKMELSEIIKII